MATPDEPSVRLAAFSVASVVVHVVAMLVSRDLAFEPTLIEPTTSARPIVVELLPEAPRPSESAAEPIEPGPRVEPPNENAVPVPHRRPRRAASQGTIVVAATIPSIEPPVVVAPPEPAPVVAPARIPRPEDVAIAAMTPDFGEPTSAADTERALEQELNEALRPAPLVQARELNLRRISGGRYRFEGRTIRATINSDGSVDFESQSSPSAQLGPEVPPGSEEDPGPVGARRRIPHSGDVLGREPTLSPSLGVVSGRFGSAGDPGASEEASWFLEETLALRDRLTDAVVARERRHGRAGLERRLDRIWREGGPARARRRQVFELWDDCAEDEVGAVGRALIYRWIVRRIPAAGSGAFTTPELNALNEGRVSAEPFAPYRAPTPSP